MMDIVSTTCGTSRDMIIPGKRSFAAKCFKGILVTTAVVTCVWIGLLFQSLRFNNAGISDRREYTQRYVAPVRVFTKVLTMPGGDSEPSAPPWPLPTAPIIREPWQLGENETETTDDQNGHRYITTKFFMSPGQGNLMFQYASIFGIAWLHNATVVIPEGLLIRRAFRFPGATVVTNRINMYFLKNWQRSAYAQCCRYYEETQHLVNGTKFALYGYFQSYKYFHNGDLELRRALRAQFQFLPEIELLARTHVNQALRGWSDTNRPHPVLIGIHVRRGLDIIWNSRNQQHGHTVATKAYFLKAMAYFRLKFKRNTLFLVCSDDYYWVKETFGHLEDVRIVRSNHREVDMCVLSMCNHTIMSQGTFSWWAAYLAGGETIYYNGWPRPHSPLADMMVKDDYFLPEWIPME